jgi:hypothetical protein
MRKIRTAALIAVLHSGLALASVVVAGMSSDNYGVPWDARYGGGGLTRSANYAINGTVGQGAIGRTASDNYGVGAGYWYGAVVRYSVYLPLVVRGYP